MSPDPMERRVTANLWTSSSADEEIEEDGCLAAPSRRVKGVQYSELAFRVFIRRRVAGPTVTVAIDVPAFCTGDPS